MLIAAIRCLIFALLLATCNSAALAESVSATHQACDVYRQFNRQCRCAGADHYFFEYGEKYCERFMQTDSWSSAGRRWRDRTLACLTQELRVDLAQAFHGCDCAMVKAFAFASHGRCYTQKPLSACTLPLSDLGLIYRILDLADWLDPDGSRQVFGITLSCIWQNRNADARPDFLTQ